MDNLFGVPMTTLAAVMSALFALVLGGVLVLALRNRVLFKLGVRNIPRRRQETVLIVLGLMLATLITSAAFVTGDTLAHTIRMQAVARLGEIDEVVRVPGRGGDAETRLDYFSQERAFAIVQALAGDPNVETVAPAISEQATIIAPKQRLSVPQASITAASPADLQALKAPRSLDSGSVVSLADLGPSEVYLSESAAEELDVSVGDAVDVYFGTSPTPLTVRAIVQDGGAGGRDEAAYLPLVRAQELFKRPDQVNRVWVSNAGGPLAGAERSEAVRSALVPLLEGTNLEVNLVKQEDVETAEEAGNAFVTIFVLFGLFSIAAGVLLIFLIFVMLAAERKPEMGMARAVGMQRRHLVQTFLMEGAVYDLIAAAVGAILGVVVGFGLVRVMATAFAPDDDFQIAFHVEPRSVVVAYTAGMVLTFIVVTVSAWRVSVLNIVRAIRDLPEPRLARGNRRAFVLSLVALVLGLLLAVIGLQSAVLFSFSLGVSLVIIGASLVARRFGLPERAAFTFAGVALLVFWLVPSEDWGGVLPEFQQGIEMFFLSGVMMVAGAVWTVMYNADLIIGGIVRLLGPSRRLAPILKMAISYPLHNRFRTGMTLAMFSLVVFTIIFMSVIVQVNTAVFSQRDRLTGGMDVIAQTSFTNPIPDLRAAIAGAEDVNADNYEIVAGVAAVPAKMRQVGGQTTEPKDYLVRGADDVYLANIETDVMVKAPGYETAEAVWEAVRTTPGLAVVDAFVVPSRSNFNVVVGGPQFRLEGVYVEDETMEPVQLEVQEPFTGRISTVTVIGVLDNLSFFSSGVYVSRETLGAITPVPLPATTWFARLAPGVDADAAAKALESAFLEQGMETQVLDDIIAEGQRQQRTVTLLLQGFMGLGLLVGIAALGVISARAVVERRRQIGALRAIGFQKGMVQASFLMESSFVAILGITIGAALGLALSYVVTGFIVEDLGLQGAEFSVPWASVLVIVAISYLASLLTTAYPAWQASRVYPAEALRYE